MVGEHSEFALAQLDLGDLAAHHLPDGLVGGVREVMDPLVGAIRHEGEVAHHLHVSWQRGVHEVPVGHEAF